MPRHPTTRATRGASLIEDLEALALALGILGVLLALCIAAAISPDAL